ncbi:MAG: phosphatase PAP2 family protein [Proteobacteria bacterium]|nr:phosphatase PAP2 family protein [Pseudomonadota bacterium]
MTHPDTHLFLLMTAGPSPAAWLLPVASAIAEGGAWLCAALMGWAAWRQPRDRGYLLAALAMAGVASFLAHALADRIGLPRPFVLGLAPAHIAHGPSPAMPSTHATVMCFIALAFAARPTLRRWAPAAALLALATGWARVYVGVHFPSDIAAGLVLALAIQGLFMVLQGLATRRLAPAFARIQQGAGATQERLP